MIAQSIAEEAGFMYVTDAALEKREQGRIEGDTLAHYQLLNSRDRGTDVYWIERLGRKDSWHLVEIMSHDGLVWASCDCDWFLNFRRPSTVCVHVLAAVRMHQTRNRQ